MPTLTIFNHNSVPFPNCSQFNMLNKDKHSESKTYDVKSVINNHSNNTTNTIGTSDIQDWRNTMTRKKKEIYMKFSVGSIRFYVRFDQLTNKHGSFHRIPFVCHNSSE